jgi:hypothetical protein
LSPPLRPFNPGVQPTEILAELPIGTGSGPGGVGQVADEAKWLLQRHETYLEDCRWWKFLRESLLGGRAWKNGQNLPPHTLETEGSGQGTYGRMAGTAGGGGGPGVRARQGYELRLEQAGRFNLVNDIREPMLGYLRGSPPDRSAIAKVPGLDKFLERCDRGRTKSLDKFMLGKVADDAAFIGTVWVGVDFQVTTEELRTLVAEDEGKVVEREDGVEVQNAEAVVNDLGDRGLPYLYVVLPEDMLYARFDDSGNLTEALVRETRDNGQDIKSGKAGYETVFRYWTLDTWELFALRKKGDHGKYEAVLLDSGVNKYGQANKHLALFRVAVAPVDEQPFRGRSAVEDDALVDRMLADVLSSLSFSVTNGSDIKLDIFTSLAAFEGKTPIEKENYLNSLVEGGTAPIGIFSEGTKLEERQRFFVGATLMLEMFQSLYRLALQTRGLGDKVSDVTSPESGIAKFRAFRILNAGLVIIGEALGEVEIKLLRAAAFFLGGTSAMKQIKPDASVYPQDYDVADLASLIALREALDGKAPDEILNWLTGQILRKGFPNRSTKLTEEHENALKKFKPSEQQVAGLLGRFGEEAGGGPPAGEEEEGEEEGAKGPPPVRKAPAVPPRAGAAA